MNLLSNNKNGKHLRLSERLTAILLCAVLTLSLFMPVMAAALDTNTPKQEVVYINLNTDGSVNRIYVVNIFELTEDGQIIDYGDYTTLRNMTTNDEIGFENQTVKIDTTAGKLYYEGELNHNIIPWIFKIRYFMDGIEYPAGELGGESGDVKITMSVRQNPDCNSTFFDSFALQASLTLDTNRFKNIVAADATMANVGSDKQISYNLLPGKEKDITITARVTDFEMTGISINGLPLGMDIDIDTKDNADFNEQIDELTDAVTELDDGANELLDGSIELRDGALELKEGVVELRDGTNELYDGVAELRDGVDELYDGSVDLKSGAKDLLDGAIELRDGASDLKDGAKNLTDGIHYAAKNTLELLEGAEKASVGAGAISFGATKLHNGLKALDGQSKTLVDGAYAVFVQLTEQAQMQINAKLAAAEMGPIDLTPANYSVVLENLLAALSGGDSLEGKAAMGRNIRRQAETAVVEQIEDATSTDSNSMEQIDAAVESGYGIEIDTNAQTDAALDSARGVQNDDPNASLQSAEGQDAVTDYVSTSEERSAYAEAAVPQQIDAQISTSEVQEQTDAEVQEQLFDGDVQAQVREAVNCALGDPSVYQSIIALKSQLDLYNDFYVGLRQYTAGINEAASGTYDIYNGAMELSNGVEGLRLGTKALYDGLLKLQDGSAELLKGTITLYDGTLKLYDGVIELKDGTIELYDGAIELKDGVKELYDGTIELKDGVIELLDGAIEMYDGTIELYDGMIELTDGTFEFKDKTANLDQDLKDTINDAINEMLGKDIDLISFASDRNTNIESVQFVIKTPAVEQSGNTYIEPMVVETLSFWQKLLRLFGWY